MGFGGRAGRPAAGGSAGRRVPESGICGWAVGAGMPAQVPSEGSRREEGGAREGFQERGERVKQPRREPRSKQTRELQEAQRDQRPTWGYWP